MSVMRIIRDIFVPIFLISLLALSACGKEDNPGYCIEVELVNGRVAHKASLYVFIPEYEKVALIDSDKVVDNRFLLNGRFCGKAEAYVALDDSCVYCFILSDSLMKMEIGRNGYIIRGTADNELLSSLLMRRQTAVNEKYRIQKEYLDMQADSMLTKEKEDSLLYLYRRQSAEFKDDVLALLNEHGENHELSDIAYRLFSYVLTQSEADSIQLTLKKS